MRLFTIFGALILVIIFCSFLFKKDCERRQIAFKIIDEIVEKYEKKYGLRFSGLIQSAPGGIYRNIGLNFSYDGVLTKSEGRVILTDVATTFLEKINSEESFKKYLRDVPFTEDNIVINIYLVPKGRSSPYYPEVKSFSFYLGKLRYKYDTPETENRRGDYYLEETESLEDTKKTLGY